MIYIFSGLTNMRTNQDIMPSNDHQLHTRLPTFDQPLCDSRHFSFIIQVYQLPSVVLTYLTGIRPRKLPAIKIPVALSIKKGIKYLTWVCWYKQQKQQLSQSYMLHSVKHVMWGGGCKRWEIVVTIFLEAFYWMEIKLFWNGFQRFNQWCSYQWVAFIL